jgi:hypothetical protein
MFCDAAYAMRPYVVIIAMIDRLCSLFLCSIGGTDC